MERIYLDNASTTFPKPPVVAEAVYRYLTEGGCNINRGRRRSRSTRRARPSATSLEGPVPRRWPLPEM